MVSYGMVCIVSYSMVLYRIVWYCTVLCIVGEETEVAVKVDTDEEKVTEQIKTELDDQIKQEFSNQHEFVKSPPPSSSAAAKSGENPTEHVAGPHPLGAQQNSDVPPPSGGALGKATHEFFNKSMVSSQAMNVAPSKCWFSLLPRRPCDENSLTLHHSYHSRVFTPTYSKKGDADLVNARQPIARPPGRPPKASNPIAYQQSLLSVLSRGGNPMSGALGESLQLLQGFAPVSPEKQLNACTQASATASASTVSLSFEDLRKSVLESLRQEPAPIPAELQHGWWRITEPAQLKELTKALHTRSASRWAISGVSLVLYVFIKWRGQHFPGVWFNIASSKHVGSWENTRVALGNHEASSSFPHV